MTGFGAENAGTCRRMPAFGASTGQRNGSIIWTSSMSLAGILDV